MNIKKISAAVIAAAVLVVAAPMTGVLPDPLSVSVSAASPDPVQTNYEVGDVFYADYNGNIEASDSLSGGLDYVCTVLTDNTIAVHFISAAFHISQNITVPSQISGYTVTTIDKGSRYVDSVTIPDTVTTIGESAFADNFFLKEVNFGANSQLNLIDQWAFQNCRSLKSISIPAGVETIAYGAFLNNEKKLSWSPQEDFTNTYSLESVTFAEGSKLKTIGEYAFQDQKSLTSIAIPEGTDSIAKNTFEGSALKNIDGVASSYAETFAKENGYTFNSGSSEQPSKPDDTSKPTDTPTTFTDDSGDKAADVQVIAKPNVIPKEAHFSVRLDDKNTTAERIAYNCYFTYNGGEYEPTDTVTVRIPVPVAMRDIANTLKVYHLQDGKYVNMSAEVEDGYLAFDTDHFSVYVVTAENLENDGTSTPTTSDTSSSAPTSSDTASSAPTEPDKGNPDTGVTAIAVTAGAAALAGAVALVASKKRK